MEKVCSQCVELQTIIDKQKHTIDIFNVELDCLFMQQDQNCKETADLNLEINILKKQLWDIQKVKMVNFAKRREEALLNYQDEYYQKHPDDTRPSPPVQVNGFYVMEHDEKEDVIDVPLLPLPYPKR